MKWWQGTSTSLPEDQRAFVECDGGGQWWVYETGADGRLLKGFPKLSEEPFSCRGDAEAWVEANVAAREHVPDCIQRAMSEGLVRYAECRRVGELKKWVDRVVQIAGTSAIWVSDQSCVGDFCDAAGVERLGEACGRGVSGSDLVVDVAGWLRQAGDFVS